MTSMSGWFYAIAIIWTCTCIAAMAISWSIIRGTKRWRAELHRERKLRDEREARYQEERRREREMRRRGLAGEFGVKRTEAAAAQAATPFAVAD